MNLVWVKITGFRRFAETTKLDVSGKLVALVGPNEAGKSSVLEVLPSVLDEDEFAASALTRGQEANSRAILESAFFLDEGDRQALSNVPGGSRVCWFKVYKYADGSRRYNLEPKLSRDLTPRRKTIAALERATSHAAINSIEVDDEEDTPVAHLMSLLEVLRNGKENLKPPEKAAIDETAASIEPHITDSMPKYIRDLPKQLRLLRKCEDLGNPWQTAVTILKQRLPQYLEFTPGERELASDYQLDEESASPSAPLRNLCIISGLDLNKLSGAIEGQDQAEVRTIISRANERLAIAFEETWSQSKVLVRFHIDGRTLYLQLEDPGLQFTSLGDRSDGLQQFVALMAFTTVKRASEPILLIDEAETHLHYDGQADLMQMLAKQAVARKVIYTTHSAGCLPEDLGTGVRLVQPKKGTNQSRIENWFWREGDPGFSPLLFGMGATTLAFFPVRKAVLVEGVSDLILMPSLLREVMERDDLGFQLVPGLSNANGAQLRLLESHGSHALYLVDNDQGGRDLRKFLIANGIEISNIMAIASSRSAVETVEDLLAAKVFLGAVNETLHMFQPESKISLRLSEVPLAGRSAALEKWCSRKRLRPLSKRAIAYNVLEQKSRKPNGRIADSKRHQAVRAVYRRLEKRFVEITSAKEGRKGE